MNEEKMERNNIRVKVIMRPTENKSADFLINAANDVAGNIRFLDTKMALLIAAMSVISGALVTCKEEFYYAYNHFVDTQNLFVFLLSLYCVLVILTFITSLLCVFPRHENAEKETDKYDEHGSLWYFFPKKEKLNFAEYGKKVGSLNEVKFINQLANQVYVLNQINEKKHFWAQKAVIFFGCSCALGVLLALFPCLYYLG